MMVGKEIQIIVKNFAQTTEGILRQSFLINFLIY